MAITLIQAQAKLDKLLDEYDKAMEMEAYTVGSGEQEVKRVNLKTMLNAIQYWERRVDVLSGERKGVRIKYGVPHG